MSKASKYPLSEIPSLYSAPIDLFICSASFEERCLSVANQLDPNQVATTFICANEGTKSTLPFLIKNKEALYSRFQASAVDILLPLDAPLPTADNLIKALDKLLQQRQIKTCLVDITAFTQEALLILLQIIARKLGSAGCNIDFIYTAASEYSINEPEGQKWLTGGTNTVRSVLGYSGEFDPSQGLHLIILLGMEEEKAMKLVNMFEPAKLSFGLSRNYTSVNPGHSELIRMNFNKLPISRTDVETFSFSCTNPHQTQIDLARHVAKFPYYNTVIEAQNTKLSTLGAGLYAMQHPEVQLCYGPVSKYNVNGYSKPDEFCYVYSRKFNRHSLYYAAKRGVVEFAHL